MTAGYTVRELTLDAAGVQLSALLAEPDSGAGVPRGVVVAMHGVGMRAGYFDGRAVPGQSLLDLGAGLGWSVLAIDRPGYGSSAVELTAGQPLADQAETIWAGIEDFATRYPTGAGFGLVGHSFGGKVALAAAGLPARRGLIGVDVSGCGLRYAVDILDLMTPDQNQWPLHWGLLRHYPPQAFRLAARLISPTPAVELHEALVWDSRLPGIAAGIQVPVRFTFAEQERFWRRGPEADAELVTLFEGNTVRVEGQPHAGHNISLGWAARAYHLRVLAFLEECLLRGAEMCHLGGK